jgi:hypothetical protein
MKFLAPLLVLSFASCNTPDTQTMSVKVAGPVKVGPFQGSPHTWLRKAVDAVAAFDGNTKTKNMITAGEIQRQLEKAKSLYPKGTPPAFVQPADKLFRAGFAEIAEAARSLKVAELREPSGSSTDSTSEATKRYNHGFELIDKAIETANDALIGVVTPEDDEEEPGEGTILLDEKELIWMLLKQTTVADLEKAQRATNPKVRANLLAKALKSYPQGPVPPLWKKSDTVLRQAFREMKLASSLFNQAANSKSRATSRSQTQQAQRHLTQSKKLAAQLESLERQGIKASTSKER